VTNISNISSRKISFFIIILIYVIAFLAGFLAFWFLYYSSRNIILSTFIGDVIATLIIWIFGIIFNNSSVYDPYWSIAPIVILAWWITIYNFILKNSFSTIQILFIIAIVVWGVRLTFNWAVRWKGLLHEDWRYKMFREKNPKLWFLTNIIGINLMPTIIVFLALVPVYYGTVNGQQYNFLTFIGFLVCISAVLIQAIADRQMDLFRNNIRMKENHIDVGLWRFSRHPNYFGEVLFWWGIWIMQISVKLSLWFTVVGPILVTLLFVFISIPMMEKYILSKKSSYIIYKRQVSMLIPWFRFKIEEKKEQ
jgi:steroid 5-alpha reductase family enzyme